MKRLILCADWIITSAEHPPIHQGAIVIEGKKVLDVGPQREILARYPNDKVVNLQHKLIFPGLVNAHTHAPMSIFRGIAEDLPLMTWLREYIWPVESKIKREWVYWGTKLALI